MIDKFGQIMVYVKDPRACADFWVQKIGFVELKENKIQGKVNSIELAPNKDADTNLVLFDVEFVKKMSPEINIGTPSVLFSTYNVQEMRNQLIEKGVTVGQMVNMSDRIVFNFSDIENNYFAVRQIQQTNKT